MFGSTSRSAKVYTNDTVAASASNLALCQPVSIMVTHKVSIISYYTTPSVNQAMRFQISTVANPTVVLASANYSLVPRFDFTTVDIYLDMPITLNAGTSYYFCWVNPTPSTKTNPYYYISSSHPSNIYTFGTSLSPYFLAKSLNPFQIGSNYSDTNAIAFMVCEYLHL